MNRAAVVPGLVFLLAAFTAAGETQPKETADEFAVRVNKELAESGKEFAQATWVQLTYITPDTEALAAKTYERFQATVARLIAESRAHAGKKMSPNPRARSGS